MHSLLHRVLPRSLPILAVPLAFAPGTKLENAYHGTVVSPVSRVYRVYKSNPQSPNFQLARNAVQLDGTLSYYTWNEVSRNIPAAVKAGLPPGFDYSKWIPDGQLASAGRVDPKSTQYPRTYAGLDQVSPDWPKTTVVAGETITVDFLATAAHNPTVWDVWMTTPNWDANTMLRWSHMEFLGRPNVKLSAGHYTFPLEIPKNRRGHHVLWIAWQRNDPAGEVFISTSDLEVRPVNDTCQGAIAVADGRTGPHSTVDATSSTLAASCSIGGGADVWFVYTATCSGTLRADTCSGTGNFDSTVSIWSGACGSLKEIGCDDNGCGLASVATAAVVANASYYVKVGGHRGKSPGEFDLTISYDNGTGRFSKSSSGCGSAKLSATGAPNIGGIVDYAVTGTVGSTQLLWVGVSATSAPLCTGCVLGTDITIAVTGHLSARIPCDPNLIGVHWFVQGADVNGTSGGCKLGGGVDFTLTDTIRTDVGR